jgi:hypothetical protein
LQIHALLNRVCMNFFFPNYLTKRQKKSSNTTFIDKYKYMYEYCEVQLLTSFSFSSELKNIKLIF